MPTFSETSKRRLSECDERLQKLFNEVIKVFDCSVICGYRGPEEQEAAFVAGTSHAHFGQSPHNTIPARAIDVVPYPVDWQQIEKFEQLGAIVLEVAARQGVKVRWGRDFKNLKDYPHWEVID